MANAASLEAPAVRAQPQQAGAMRRALWIATKFFVFMLTVWTWYEIDDIEAGMIQGGRAKLAVAAIMVIGLIFLSPTEPTTEWMAMKMFDDD